MVADMVRNLRLLGVREGGDLLVHSSYKSLGGSAGSIEDVITALKTAVGVGGHLLMPTLSYESVNNDSPHFDICTTPSCVGVITECFRKQPGVFRSMHPTHSVAVYGPKAEEIAGQHHLDDTPVGCNSPFSKLRDRGGQILMLGCGLMPNTSMHGVEELARPPYLFKNKNTYTCVDIDGVATVMTVRRHHFHNANGDRVIQRYDRLKYVLPAGILRSGKMLQADCYLFEARAMWDVAKKILTEDPLFFVDYGRRSH